MIVYMVPHPEKLMSLKYVDQNLVKVCHLTIFIKHSRQKVEKDQSLVVHCFLTMHKGVFLCGFTRKAAIQVYLLVNHFLEIALLLSLVCGCPVFV